MQKELARIVFEKSFRYDPDFGFTLSSGTKSDVYVDVKKTVYSPQGMELVGKVMCEKLKDLDYDGIGGLTLGADPIALATALVSTQQGKPVEVFVVRKEAKKHGTERWVEGNLTEGARVVVVDDVATTGASTIKAIERAREAGFEVVKAVVFVDREEGGLDAIKKYCDAEAVITRTELVALWKRDIEGRA